MAVDIRNEVLRRVYMVLFIVVLVAVAIFVKALKITITDGDKWREKGKNLYVSHKAVEAERGNILTEDGSLLATSLPFFEIRFDLNSTGMKEDDFFDNLDSLAYCLATFVDPSYTVGGMRERLLISREEGHRNLLIKRSASYLEKEMISQFPLFNKGQYRGGFKVEPKPKRARPFKRLARRTVGRVDGVDNPFGLEARFDDNLTGEEGERVMFRAPNNTWIPMNDLTEIEPQKGDDIVTTLDVNLQSVAHEALLRGMRHHLAESGTAILMEVKTGAIKAIANLGKTDDGYFEVYNYAIGSKYEPGSTFKLASIMALLEDGHIDLYDSVVINRGKMMFYEEEMVDASKESFNIDTTTVRRAFEISSNVGIASLVDKYYGDDDKGQARQFIKRLKEMKLHLPVNIEIDGEASPYIKEAYSKEDKWSGITLPWMSIGYEVELTPLQLLNFFNAVANDGQMMKPYLVSEIQHFGNPIQQFKPTVIDRQIASPETIRKAKILLESVVENGTAYKLKTSKYKFAGKTGTAQIDYRKFGGFRQDVKHSASFVSYFPTHNPIYSCVVVIRNPTQNGFYGGDVAGPIFREIADNCFAQKIELHRALNERPKPTLVSKQLPTFSVGNKTDIIKALDYLNLPYQNYANNDWAVLKAESDTLSILTRKISEDIVPNVVGMGLRDALYILENMGMEVLVNGAGKVTLQSIKSGTKAQGQTIKLTLN